MGAKGHKPSSSHRSNISIDSSIILSKKWSLFSRDKKLILAFMISSLYVLVSLVIGMINVLLETGLHHMFRTYIADIYLLRLLWL